MTYDYDRTASDNWEKSQVLNLIDSFMKEVHEVTGGRRIEAEAGGAMMAYAVVEGAEFKGGYKGDPDGDVHMSVYWKDGKADLRMWVAASRKETQLLKVSISPTDDPKALLPAVLKKLKSMVAPSRKVGSYDYDRTFDMKSTG
jgi:hypothetical protein